jgi:hypothetical protein
MIDGVKVKCLGINAKDWEENSLLDFKSGVVLETGEILDNGKKVAFYNGLYFQLIPSTVSETTHCYIKGSIAKYHTDGKTNAFDFTASMLLTVLNDLKEKFNIDPSKAVLENLEYGLNIIPPIEVKKVIKGLIAYKNNGFKTFSIPDTELGQCIGMKNYQTIKFYHKTEQDTNALSNLLRIEIAVKRMSIISKYGIKTLADLTAIKVNPLLQNILNVWNDCIFIDEKRKYREMAGFERSKWLFYINPRKWEDLEKKQRYRMKKHFIHLNSKYGLGNIKEEISLLITQKIKELTAETTLENVHLLHSFSNTFNSPKTKPKCPPFTRLDKGVKGTLKTIKNSKGNGHKKINKKCKVCSKDISTQKAGSKFCSKHCNNSFHASKRTEVRRLKIQTEKENLSTLLKTIEIDFNWCLISYQMENQSYSDILNQTEIYCKGITAKSVFRVVVSSTINFENEIELNSFRARKYIQMLNNYNIKNTQITGIESLAK